MTLPLDRLIDLAAARTDDDGEVAVLDQADTAIRAAARDADVDLANATEARAVAFGAATPIYVAGAIGPDGAVRIARHLTARAAAAAKEQTP